MKVFVVRSGSNRNGDSTSSAFLSKAGAEASLPGLCEEWRKCYGGHPYVLEKYPNSDHWRTRSGFHAIITEVEVKP